MKCFRASQPFITQGFSLVEVAISMAVVSFAIISILGLVPMGMTNFRLALNNTVQSQIVQSVTSELEQTSFTNAVFTPGTSTYGTYDNDGNATTLASQVIYTAALTVAPVNGTSQPVNLVNSTANVPTTMQTSANAVTISIVNKSQPAQTNTYSIIVANQNN
jgi:uncharacterized protein (TIGR02598 family)